MRACKVFVLFLGLFLLVVPGRAAESGTCTISGHWPDSGAKELVIGSQRVPVAPDGSFVCTMGVERPAFVTLKGDLILDLYLMPGHTLRLDFPQGSGSVAFSGDLGKINSFWQPLSSDFFKQRKAFYKDPVSRFSQELPSFVEAVDALMAPVLERLEGWNAASERDRTFVEDARRRMTFIRANLLLEYPGGVRRFTPRSTWQPPAGYTDFINDLPFDEARSLGSEDCKTFIDSWCLLQADRKAASGDEPEHRFFPALWRQLPVILATVKDPVVRDFLMQKRLNQLLDEHDSRHYAGIAAELRKYCLDPAGMGKRIARAEAEERALEKDVLRRVYKVLGGVNLEAFVYRPEGWQRGDSRAAVAYFHGGGWNIGGPLWGDDDCRHLAGLGLVAVSFDYRLIAAHGVTPVESMRDARSALRWLRMHAQELGIDPERIAACGFSAGGHLAACTGGLKGFDEPGEDTSIRSTSDALLLWSAPVRFEDEDSDPWFTRNVRGHADIHDCSPYDHLQKGQPPAILFQGADDTLVCPRYARDYAQRMKELGNRCELHLYPGQWHLPWPRALRQNVWARMEAFLGSLGFIAAR